MTDPRIPSIEDFLATPDVVDEALENNRRNGLPAKPPTEIRRKQPDGTVAVWTSTTPAGAAAWTDDMLKAIADLWCAEQIQCWENDHDRSLTITHKYFPDQYQRILNALDEQREEVSTTRMW